MRLGRIRPTAEQKRRALPLERYLSKPLPEAPLAIDNTAGVSYILGGNDRYGDCTVVALANFHLTAAAREGRKLSISDDEAIAFYQAMSAPGRDDGLVEIDVLERARAAGFPLSGAHKLAAWVRIDPLDLASIRACAALFYAVYVGAALPLSARSPGTWDAVSLIDDEDVPGSWGGHAMIAPQYDSLGVSFITWGRKQRATWAWWRLYVEEGYALLDAERAAAAGVDWPALTADLAAIDSGGSP